jgi:hypothetical protein
MGNIQQQSTGNTEFFCAEETKIPCSGNGIKI